MRQVILRAEGEDRWISSLSQQARIMARTLTPLSTPYVEEMHHRCWWSINRVQNRCAEESQAAVLGSSWWNDFELPLNLNDGDLHPTLEVAPRSRRGITDCTLLIVRLEYVCLIETIAEKLNAVPSPATVKQCRDLVSRKRHSLEHDYIQHADDSRRCDGFLILTCKVLQVCVSSTLYRRLPKLTFAGQNRYDAPTSGGPLHR